jgi:hypothetical protein
MLEERDRWIFIQKNNRKRPMERIISRRKKGHTVPFIVMRNVVTLWDFHCFFVEIFLEVFENVKNGYPALK